MEFNDRRKTASVKVVPGRGENHNKLFNNYQTRILKDRKSGQAATDAGARILYSNAVGTPDVGPKVMKIKSK